MFFLNSIPQIAYTNPWEIQIRKRLNMLAKGRKRIAYFYEQPDRATFRYRVYNITQVLNTSDEDESISASYFFLEDLPYFDEIADLADILVICRAKYDHHISHLINSFRRRHKKIFFDVDDLVFDIDYFLLIISTSDFKFSQCELNDWASRTSRYGLTLKQCDGALVTNLFLANQVKKFVNMPTAVIPNFLNKEQVEISEKIFSAKKNVPFGQDGFIHIGYFSGSNTHNKDFEIIIPALELLLKEIPNLCLVIVGYLHEEKLSSKFHDRIKRIPFCDFVNLQRMIGSVEFNVAPLKYNVFTNCKSELKYFEAAAVGTPTIASPTYAFTRAIQNGHNGWIAYAHEWYHIIRKLIYDVDDYRRVVDCARAHAIQNYAWYNQKHIILEAFQSLGVKL